MAGAQPTLLSTTLNVWYVSSLVNSVFSFVRCCLVCLFAWGLTAPIKKFSL